MATMITTKTTKNDKIKWLSMFGVEKESRKAVYMASRKLREWFKKKGNLKSHWNLKATVR